MTEPVLIVLGFRNDAGKEQPAACITALHGHRKPIYQHLSEIELETFNDNLTGLWEAEWFGDLYELLAPITQEEADEMAYRCAETEDFFA